MAGRIVLFGATGYTGRLTAEALLSAGARPLLAGRNRQSLESLADELGEDLETATADVADPASVRGLLGPGDVMLSTVGPFARWGAPAIEAAIDAGAPYIDSTGEPPFIRRVFEGWGGAAEKAGSPLLTALGYDWAPGNLAGALALAEAGEGARSIDIGYFMTGGGSAGGMSGGTMASMAGALLEPGFAYSDGRIVTEQGGRRVRSFEVADKTRRAISIGSSEHFTLPALHSGLTDVNAYLGWFGPLSRPMQAGSFALGAITRVPSAKRLLTSTADRFIKGSTGGPTEQERAGSGSHIVAIARDHSGKELAQVRLDGVDGYTFTAAFLAWAAGRALEGGIEGSGALGPAAAFGLEEFERGVAGAGISRT
ncbi:MAG: saccharopine dehydrogenase NADP-binding domain-containing protein [Solirubrobacterales bacterium]|nr:saccharopine dehydrogenase NADP-binding domain-containing protein [Solirubrobacterales bacterium]